MSKTMMTNTVCPLYLKIKILNTNKTTHTNTYLSVTKQINDVQGEGFEWLSIEARA